MLKVLKVSVLLFLPISPYAPESIRKGKIPLARRGALKAAKAFKPGADLEGGTWGVTLPEMTCGFLIKTVQSLYSYTKSAVSFDMHSQQFTYLCLVKSLLLRIAF